MAPPCISELLFLVLVLLASLLASPAAAMGGMPAIDWIPSESACGKTIGQCVGSDEFDLASESSRRILATSSYISYEALRRGSVPCSRRGASYYNCRAGAQANPYSRGCSRITRCRS